MRRTDGHTRPRVEGDRETEILDATLDLLVVVGYDRLTMDGVAAEAKASKATLYRRWSTKADLVIDALLNAKGAPNLSVPDTGSLRGDLVEMACGAAGLTSRKPAQILASVITAIHRDESFAKAFREQFLGPKIAVSQTIYQRAKERGEISADIDVSLLGPALAGIVLHRAFLLNLANDPDTVIRIIDEIILPAATRKPTHSNKDSS